MSQEYNYEIVQENSFMIFMSIVIRNFIIRVDHEINPSCCRYLKFRIIFSKISLANNAEGEINTRCNTRQKSFFSKYKFKNKVAAGSVHGMSF